MGCNKQCENCPGINCSTYQLFMTVCLSSQGLQSTTFISVLHFGEVKVLACYPLVCLDHIITSGFEVSGSIIGLGDERLR